MLKGFVKTTALVNIEYEGVSRQALGNTKAIYLFIYQQLEKQLIFVSLLHFHEDVNRFSGAWKFR